MLEEKIAAATEGVKEQTRELNSAIENAAKANEYRHLEEEERGELIRKDI